MDGALRTGRSPDAGYGPRAGVTQPRAGLRYGAAHGTLVDVEEPGPPTGRNISRPSAPGPAHTETLPDGERRTLPLGGPGLHQLRGGLAWRSCRALLVMWFRRPASGRHHHPEGL